LWEDQSQHFIAGDQDTDMSEENLKLMKVNHSPKFGIYDPERRFESQAGFISNNCIFHGWILMKTSFVKTWKASQKPVVSHS
jgi:hypothetical protein